MKRGKFLWQDGLGALQWFVFLLANAMALPIVIGEIFQLQTTDVAGLMQRTFFVVGITSFLQGWIGHRLPIADGPAGIWLGVFVIMGEMAVRQGSDLTLTLQSLQGGMLVTAGILIFLGVLGWIQKFLRFFTPLVTGTYLLLLAIQLSGVFLKGMLGIEGESLSIHPGAALVGLGVFLLVLGVSAWGRGWIKSYAVLIGLVLGWILYEGFGLRETAAISQSGSFLPEVFAWGMPQWDLGMALSGVLVAMILISNTVGSLTAVGEVLRPGSSLDKQALNRGGWMGGIANALSAIFSTVGMVPLSVSAGLIRLTGQKRMRPFLIACLLFTGMALIPPIIRFLATVPGPVAYAVLFASFAQLIGIGLQTILRDKLDERRLTILGVTLMVGVGTMFLPVELFSTLPSVVQSIASNGLLLGTLVAVTLEQIWVTKRA